MKTLITPRSGNRNDYLKLARQLDERVDEITSNFPPTDHNADLVNSLTVRAEDIRKMVANWN
jgi:hypothetical protein